jgi:membrane-bound ClpP family serine protease
MNELSPKTVLIALCVGAVFFTAVKLAWGMTQWGRKTSYRLGDRWGDEPVEVTEWANGEGYVSAGGELWRAASSDALKPGDMVIVSKTKGLTLDVRKA